MPAELLAHTKKTIESLPPGDYCFFCLHPSPRRSLTPSQILYTCIACGKTDGLILRIGQGLKSTWHNDALQHFTIGALLKNKASGKFLLMKKRTYPQIIDVIAGHIKTEETPEVTLERELKQETGLPLLAHRLIWEGLAANLLCRRGASYHYWHLYLCAFDQTPIPDVQEVDYFKEYTWEEVLAEPIFNPSIKTALAGLNIALLTLP